MAYSEKELLNHGEVGKVILKGTLARFGAKSEKFRQNGRSELGPMSFAGYGQR